MIVGGTGGEDSGDSIPNNLETVRDCFGTSKYA